MLASPGARRGETGREEENKPLKPVNYGEILQVRGNFHFLSIDKKEREESKRERGRQRKRERGKNERERMRERKRWRESKVQSKVSYSTLTS